MEGGHGDRCPCAFPTGFSAVMVSFRLRGISLQKQADSVGCIILLPCDVAELFPSGDCHSLPPLHCHRRGRAAQLL